MKFKKKPKDTPMRNIEAILFGYSPHGIIFYRELINMNIYNWTVALVLLSGIYFTTHAQKESIEPETEIAMALDAETHHHHNFISWHYNLTTDSGYFVVERSYDGQKFTTEGHIQKATNVTDKHEYYFIDKSRLKHRVVYYRIRVVDGATIGVSKTVGLHPVNKAFAYFKVYPTPAHHNLHINLKKGHPEWEPFSALLINQEGQVIWQDEFTTRHNTVDVDNMDPGLYELEIWLPAAEKRISEKILVK